MPSHEDMDRLVYIAPGRDRPQDDARSVITTAIKEASARGAAGLLVDLHDWAAGPSPSLAMRIDATREWAAAARPGFAVAIALPPDKIDPGRIGPILARGLGFHFNVCGSIEEARAWLEGELAAGRAG